MVEGICAVAYGAHQLHAEGLDIVDYRRVLRLVGEYRHGLNEHTQRFPQPLVHTAVVHRVVGYLVRAAEHRHGVGESGLEKEVHGNAVVLAPVVTNIADDERRPLRHLAHAAVLRRADGAEVKSGEFLRIIVLGALVNVGAEDGLLVFRRLIHSVGARLEFLAVVHRGYVILREHRGERHSVKDGVVAVPCHVSAFLRVEEFKPEKGLATEQVERPHELVVDIVESLLAAARAAHHVERHAVVAPLAHVAVVVDEETGAHLRTLAEDRLHGVGKARHIHRFGKQRVTRQVVLRGLGMFDALDEKCQLRLQQRICLHISIVIVLYKCHCVTILGTLVSVKTAIPQKNATKINKKGKADTQAH